MARPRKFDDPVAFRLPPEYQEKLDAKAERAGKPLAVYVREVLMDVLDNGHKTPARKTTATAKKTPAKRKATPPKQPPAGRRATRAAAVSAT